MNEQLSRQTTIERVLQDMITQGGFYGAVVATSDGLPIAMVGVSTIDTNLLGAVAASLKGLASRAHQNLDEICIRDQHGEQVVSRYFSITAPQGKFNLLLAVCVPPRKSYRRLFNRTIKQIQQVWVG